MRRDALFGAISSRHRMPMSRVWADTVAIPRSIEATLEAREGFTAIGALLGDDGTRRVVLTGNGAAWYVAFGASLALLEGRPTPAPVVAVPAGIIAARAFAWHPGDVLVAVSTSGELRDLVELLDPAVARSRPEGVALITASPGSTIARQAAAVAVTRLGDPAAFTHSQAYAANFVALVAILSAWSG